MSVGSVAMRGVSKHTPALQSDAASLLPLSMRSAGDSACVKSIRGKDDVQRFLRNIGFVEGAQVMLVSELNGNVIVSVKGTRVAISKVMASRILTA